MIVQRTRMRSWVVVAIGVGALALPAQAFAHGRTATVALDYRLSFDPATLAIPGLHVAGNAYQGIGIPDCIRLGRAAAERILSGGL